MADLEKVARELSSKEPKVIQKNKVTWKYADKKKKPLNVSGVCDFMITGADYNYSKIAEFLTGCGAEEITE